MRFSHTADEGAPPSLGLALSLQEAMSLRDDLNRGIAAAYRDEVADLPARAVVIAGLEPAPLPPATFKVAVHRDLAAA
jgi:hypothetical protein